MWACVKKEENTKDVTVYDHKPTDCPEGYIILEYNKLPGCGQITWSKKGGFVRIEDILQKQERLIQTELRALAIERLKAKGTWVE